MKNIEKIELGRYEMETWYYSPFPPEYRDCKVRGVGRRVGVGAVLGQLWGRSRGAAVAASRWGLGHLLQPCCHCPMSSLLCNLPSPQKLYFCEYDLQFFKHRHQMLRHLRKVGAGAGLGLK